METLLVILVIVLIILIISLRNFITERFTKIENEIKRLHRQLKDAELSSLKEKIKSAEEKSITTAVIAPPVKPEKALEPEPVSATSKPEEKPESAATRQETPTRKDYQSRLYDPVPLRKPQPSFFERHPDLEKFIGENLISKIGIAILVLAIGFFVKYAIDKNWIGAIGRVAIGILCGGILIGIAHRLRNSYKAFSSILVGGGLATLYFTIALAYHQFHLFDQTPAFIIMVIITAFAVVISLLYDRQELIIIALTGGFATPFIVSNGGNNYVALFSYLIILNTALLVIAYKKSWRILNILAFIYTIIIFISWLIFLPYNSPAIVYRNGLLFATVFYLLFFFINILHNVKENKRFIASDFSILLANTCLYFSAGLYFLHEMKTPEYRGLFSICMAVFNLVSTWVLFKKQKIDTNILYLLIGITLTFISITAPIQLHGNYITIFWASEAVLLYWLFKKSGIKLIGFASVLIWGAMLISLVMDLFNIYWDNGSPLTIIANKGFITTLYCAITTYILFLLKKENWFAVSENVLRSVSLVLLFAAGFFEIDHQVSNYFPLLPVSQLYLLTYTFVFVLILIFINSKIPAVKININIQASIIAACIFIYILCLRGIGLLQEGMLTGNIYLNHFIIHWINFMLACIAFYKLIMLIKVNTSIQKEILIPIIWILCIALVIFFSAEVFFASNALFYSEAIQFPRIHQVYLRAVLPIVWGLCSFGFMWLGMKYKFRTLRIISLTVFAVTLIKLFIFDIRDIPAGGKIAAFFCLGVLLLVISFMYQRLKKIIIDDEKVA